MGKFHNYSFGNILEIARQKRDATRVAGLYAWNQLGRKVMKGQKGIRILAPVIRVRRKKDEEAKKDIRTQNLPRRSITSTWEETAIFGDGSEAIA